MQFVLDLELPSGILSQSCRSWEPLSPARKLVGYRSVDPKTCLGAAAEGGLLEPGVPGQCEVLGMQRSAEE